MVEEFEPMFEPDERVNRNFVHVFETDSVISADRELRDTAARAEGEQREANAKASSRALNHVPRVRGVVPGLMDEWVSTAVHVLEFEHSGAVRDMHVSHNRGSVVVIPVTTLGEIIMIRQWKHGIGRYTVEFPAGYLESEREDPVAAGMRELREEAGAVSNDWRYLGALYREPGRGRTVVHVCLALAVVAAEPAHPDDTEVLESTIAEIHEVDDMLQDGRMPGLHTAGAWAVARRFVQAHLADMGEK